MNIQGKFITQLVFLKEYKEYKLLIFIILKMIETGAYFLTKPFFAK